METPSTLPPPPGARPISQHPTLPMCEGRKAHACCNGRVGGIPLRRCRRHLYLYHFSSPRVLRAGYRMHLFRSISTIGRLRRLPQDCALYTHSLTRVVRLLGMLSSSDLVRELTHGAHTVNM